MEQARAAVIVTAAIGACVAYGAIVPVNRADEPAIVAPAAAPAPAVTAPRRFTLVASGDLLSHTSVLDQARSDAGGSGYSYASMLGGVRPIIEAADLAVCHLETPVRAAGTPVDGVVPTFGAPEEIAREIAALGYDRCSLASNHALDQRAAGIDATLGAFDGVGLGHAGMARNAPEAQPARFEVNGVVVAHLSASYGFNDFSLPAGEPWRVNGIDAERLVAEARQARLDGAEVVVVSLHWGREGVTDPIDDQRRVADTLTASGAVDLIIGHHAHVVQPIEQVNGRWVVFGLGNQLSGMGESTGCCDVRALDGLMVRIGIAEQADGTFLVERPEAIPTYLGRRPYRVVPVLDALADPAVRGDIGVDTLRASLERTSAVVGGFLGSQASSGG